MLARDLTPAFDELLQKHGGAPTAKPALDPDKTQGFLKEAYRINGHIATLARQLRHVRQAYLSTAPPRRRTAGTAKTTTTSVTSLTDAQREDVDANAKRLLRDLDAAIRGLAEAEALHQETQQALLRRGAGGRGGHADAVLRLPRFIGGGVLSLGGGGGKGGAAAASAASSLSPAAAAAAEAQRQTAAHRESVLWCLRQRLQACGRAQQTMMEARLARMVEGVGGGGAAAMSMPMPTTTMVARGRGASIGRMGGPATVSTMPATALEADGNASAAPHPPPDDLTQEQLQLFARDNQDMVQHYATTLDKVRAAEQSLVEIAELQTMLVSNLEVQAAHVDQMVADADKTATNVARGNEELKKALARPSTARYTFYAAGGLCLFVVVWDFFI